MSSRSEARADRGGGPVTETDAAAESDAAAETDASARYFQRIDGAASWRVDGGAPGSVVHPTGRAVPAIFRLTELHPLSIDANVDDGPHAKHASNVACGLRVLISGRGARLRPGDVDVIRSVDFVASTERALVSFEDATNCASGLSPRKWDATKGHVHVDVKHEVVTVTLEGVVMQPRTYPPTSENARPAISRSAGVSSRDRT